VLDKFDADFANDVRNIHFRLATDGFDAIQYQLRTILLLTHLCYVVQPTTISLYEV
jgi:hypothetical protein